MRPLNFEYSTASLATKQLPNRVGTPSPNLTRSDAFFFLLVDKISRFLMYVHVLLALNQSDGRHGEVRPGFTPYE
jgi:hypothetical protein